MEIIFTDAYKNRVNFKPNNIQNFALDKRTQASTPDEELWEISYQTTFKFIWIYCKLTIYHKNNTKIAND